MDIVMMIIVSIILIGWWKYKPQEPDNKKIEDFNLPLDKYEEDLDKVFDYSKIKNQVPDIREENKEEQV